MQQYSCSVCGFIYDQESAERTPENKIIPLTNLDPEWTCPNCGVNPDMFVPIEKDELAEIDKEAIK